MTLNELASSGTADHEFQLGHDWHARGDLTSACRSYMRCLVARPDHPAATHFFGLALASRVLESNARDWLDRSILLDKKQPIFFSNYASILLREGLFEQAIHLFDVSLRLNPYSVDDYRALGDALGQLSRFSEATQAYWKTLCLAPHDARGYQNHGSLAERAGNFKLAQQLFYTALRISSEEQRADLSVNLGLMCLIRGEFALGWNLYKRRWSAPGWSHILPPLPVTAARFDADNTSGRVLLEAEQGLGDEIMFGTLISEFVARWNVSVIRVDRRLVNLFQRAFPSVQVVRRDAEISSTMYDQVLPFGDLGSLLRLKTEDFKPHRGGYLVADFVKTDEFKTRLKRTGRLLIGLSWFSTSSQHSRVPLVDILASLVDFDVDFVNLQYGDVESEVFEAEQKTGVSLLREPSVDNFSDVEGLSALISACDLVLSIGNATAHLSGALGKPTWVLLPVNPTWRWLDTGEKSLWYPKARLFRQTERGQWAGVLRSIRESLITRTSNHDT